MTDDSMDDRPIDFSSLDPTRDATRFGAMTGAITRDAMAARARRAASPPGVLAELVAWSRPALLAAAIVLAVAIPTVAYSPRGAASPAPVASATDVMGIPRRLTDLLRSSQTPSLEQLHEALASADGGGR